MSRYLEFGSHAGPSKHCESELDSLRALDMDLQHVTRAPVVFETRQAGVVFGPASAITLCEKIQYDLTIRR